jgi:carboxyl-terminal processing protease
MRNPSPMLRRLFLLFTVTLAVASQQSLLGQVRIPAEARTNEAQLRQVLQQGKVLEDERRWGEALVHYEKAAKQFPERDDVTARLQTARVHFDVSRRYGDTAFTNAIRANSEHEALDALSEVLLKIQAYSVNAPQWQVLFDRGTRNLSVALTKPVFVERVLPGWRQESINYARQQLQQLTAGQKVGSRHDLYDRATTIASELSRRAGIPQQVVLLEYTCGAASALDPYSSFLTRDQYADVMSQIAGNFVGLGIEIRNDEETLLIVNVLAGGPAAEAGLKPNERIVQVDGKTTMEVSVDTAADMLKGEEGTYVQLVVADVNGKQRQMRLERRRVEIPSVENVSIVDKQYGVGYIKLSSFQKNTLRDFNAALWALHHKGMRSLIVDVRGNPGGLLDCSVAIADKFVNEGLIVATRGRNPREDFDHQAKQFGTWRVPLVVLIDGDSASASEIFAGAIHDHHRGSIIGERSYGKGSVQGIFPLNRSGAGIRLTTAKFYSPTGTPISGRGVTPDITVYTTAKPATEGEVEAIDSTFDTALQVARRKVKQQ